MFAHAKKAKKLAVETGYKDRLQQKNAIASIPSHIEILKKQLIHTPSSCNQATYSVCIHNALCLQHHKDSPLYITGSPPPPRIYMYKGLHSAAT